MELSQHSLLDEIDTHFPNELFQSTWNFNSCDQIQDLHFSATDCNPSPLQHISLASDDHQFIHEDNNNNNYTTNNNNFLPFLDALTSQELFGSSYYDLEPISIHQHAENGEVMFLENCINAFEGKLSTPNDTPNMNTSIYSGEQKNKSKKPNGQPSKNLMAERRRRKRLNDRLSMLRSIVPKISKNAELIKQMDRASILGDSIDYMKELLDKIQKLREDENCTDQISLIGEYLKDIKSNDINQVRNRPKYDVDRRNEVTKVEVCCAARPGLLMSTVCTLDALGLDIQQCVISCFSDFSLQASCSEVAENRSLVSSDDVKLALFRNAGYGGRCL